MPRVFSLTDIEHTFGEVLVTRADTNAAPGWDSLSCALSFAPNTLIEKDQSEVVFFDYRPKALRCKRRRSINI